ncbi:MAG: hypothetical protein AAF480_12475 [Actinomycetota bacterium]
MLSSISPFGERSRNSRWWLTVSAYLVGSIAGGAATGVVAGTVGAVAFLWLDAEAGLLVLAIAAAIGLAADLGLAGLRVPSMHRQVNEDWLTTYRGWVYGAGFGFQLGLGFATIVATSTVWLTFIAAAMTGSFVRAVLLGALFGFARGVLILATARINDPASLRHLFRTIAAQAPGVNRLARVAAGLTAITAAAGLIA